MPEEVARFAALPEAERAGIRLLKGHMAFGLHELTPGPTRYITMVRDPIDRLISYYYLVRRRPGDALHAPVVDDDMDLASFVESGIARDHTDNSYVRFYSGSPFVELGSIDEALLNRAKANLSEHFILTGQQRHFDESILMLSHELGWKTPYYRSRHVAKERPKLDEIDTRTKQVLDAHTQFDREVFDHCKELFQQKLEAMPAGFDKEVRDFRRKNMIVRKAYPVLEPLRRLGSRS